MLLDSPFREIHAVRLADDGTIYAVAVNGTAGWRKPRHRSTAAARTAAIAAGAIRVDRNHVGDGDRQLRPAAPSAPVRHRTSRARPAAVRSTAFVPTASGTRCGIPVTMRRTTSSSNRRGACSSAPAPRERSSASAETRRGRRCSHAPPRARSLRFSANPPAASSAPPAIPEAVRPFTVAGATRHVRVRRPRCRHRRDLGRDPLAGDDELRRGQRLHPQRQHRDAGRDLERVVGRLLESGRRTDRQPERALPAVARGVDRHRQRSDRC